jgi:acyl-CoA dehydrogenase
MTISREALDMAAKVEAFVRETVVPYEQDPRRDHHGAPTDELVMELREKARAAGSPHIRPDGSHLNQRETAVILIPSGLSPLGMLACNTRRPTKATCTCWAMSAAPISRRASWRRWSKGARVRPSS